MENDLVATDKPEMVTKTGLKERGWTEKSIKMFAGEPDVICRNPHYRSASPMQLWKKDKIEDIEKSQSFKDWGLTRTPDKAASRRAAVEKAVLAKKEKFHKERNDLLNWIDHGKIELPELTLTELREECSLNPSNSTEYIQREMVNFLRHSSETQYDWTWETIDHYEIDRGKVIKLRNRILKKISEVYPELADECQRQKQDWRLTKKH